MAPLLLVRGFVVRTNIAWGANGRPTLHRLPIPSSTYWHLVPTAVHTSSSSPPHCYHHHLITTTTSSPPPPHHLHFTGFCSMRVWNTSAPTSTCQQRWFPTHRRRSTRHWSVAHVSLATVPLAALRVVTAMATDVVGLAVVVVGLVVQTRYAVCAGWLCVLVLVGCEPFSTCTFQPKHNNVCNPQHRPVPPVVSSPSSAATLPSRQLRVCFPINGCVTHVCRFWSMWLQTPYAWCSKKVTTQKTSRFFTTIIAQQITSSIFITIYSIVAATSAPTDYPTLHATTPPSALRVHSTHPSQNPQRHPIHRSTRIDQSNCVYTMTVSFLQDPGRSTDLLLKGPSIPSAACNVLVSKVWHCRLRMGGGGGCFWWAGAPWDFELQSSRSPPRVTWTHRLYPACVGGVEMHGCCGLEGHSGAQRPACTLIDGAATIALPARWARSNSTPTA